MHVSAPPEDPAEAAVKKALEEERLRLRAAVEAAEKREQRAADVEAEARRAEAKAAGEVRAAKAEMSKAAHPDAQRKAQTHLTKATQEQLDKAQAFLAARARKFQATEAAAAAKAACEAG